MFNENLFRAALAEIGMKVPEMAKLLGISISSLYHKMHGKSEFTRSEIQKIADVFGWERTNAIFFKRKGGK